MERWFQGFFGYRSFIATLIVAFAIALGFVPVKNWVQMFVDRYFFRGSQEELAVQNEQLRREVLQTERLKSVATLAAGMAHEIKNPLASIKTFAEYLPQKYDDPAFREKFAKIVSQEVDKMNGLVHRLLDFARPSAPKLERVRLSSLVQDTVAFLQGTLLKRHVTVRMTLSPDDAVLADPAQLRQAILNVLLNSIEAMPGPGTIAVSTARENGSLAVVIADSGPGIPRRDLQRVFDPFYTTKPGGTGLGLSVVHTILREHGGRVRVRSQVGKGTEVRLLLPLLQGGRHGEVAHLDRG
jgi:signal transduction histidine kinase